MRVAAEPGGGSRPPGTAEPGVLSRSRDSGETWQQLDSGEVAPSRMFAIAVDREAPSHIYCCARDGQVYMSYDGGETWSMSQIPGDMSRNRHVYPLVCG